MKKLSRVFRFIERSQVFRVLHNGQYKAMNVLQTTSISVFKNHYENMPIQIY